MLIRSIDSQNKCIEINWRERLSTIGKSVDTNCVICSTGLLLSIALWETLAMESVTCDLYAIR